MEQVFDLTNLAAKLPEKPAYAQFRKLVKTISSIETTVSDLEDAGAAAKQALGLVATQTTNSEALALTIESLMVYAVIAYSRASHSDPIDRFRVGADKLPRQLRAAHASIGALRDRVLAHYGHGEDQPGGRWREEPLLMRAEGQRIAFGYASTRTAFRQSVVESIAELVDHSVTELRKKVFPQHEKLAREMEVLGTIEEFAEVARACRFDHGNFFAGHSANSTPSTAFNIRPRA